MALTESTTGWAIFSTLVAVELPILVFPESPESSWGRSFRQTFWRKLWPSMMKCWG